MKKNILTSYLLVIFLFAGSVVLAQEKDQSIDTTKWVAFNREANVGNESYLDIRKRSGLLYMQNSNFGNGKIELDIKGKNIKGRSFVGVAFHGQNDSTYEAIYFRPFNFLDTIKNNKSVQYINHPKHTWYSLRKDFPQKYESNVSPIPNPDDWFHVTIIVNYPIIKVYVNNSEIPSLEIESLSSFKEGWVGYWVGNGSDGYFKDLQFNDN